MPTNPQRPLSYLQYKHVWRYVDVDTGEEINKNLALSAYIKIKITHFYSKTHKQNGKTTGLAQHTIECRRSTQTRLF